MSFETDQARLVQELADAQEQIRSQYGLPPRAKATPADARPASGTHGKRSSLTAL